MKTNFKLSNNPQLITAECNIPDDYIGDGTHTLCYTSCGVMDAFYNYLFYNHQKEFLSGWRSIGFNYFPQSIQYFGNQYDTRQPMDIQSLFNIDILPLFREHQLVIQNASISAPKTIENGIEIKQFLYYKKQVDPNKIGKFTLSQNIYSLNNVDFVWYYAAHFTEVFEERKELLEQLDSDFLESLVINVEFDNYIKASNRQSTQQIQQKTAFNNRIYDVDAAKRRIDAMNKEINDGWVKLAKPTETSQSHLAKFSGIILS